MRLRGLTTLRGGEFLMQKRASNAYHSHYLILLVAVYYSSEQAVGFIVTKKVGNAVIRNKIKRRLRVMVQHLLNEMAIVGCSYIFIPRQTACYCGFNDLKEEVLCCLRRASCLKF